MPYESTILETGATQSCVLDQLTVFSARHIDCYNLQTFHQSAPLPVSQSLLINPIGEVLADHQDESISLRVDFVWNTNVHRHKFESPRNKDAMHFRYRCMASSLSLLAWHASLAVLVCRGTHPVRVVPLLEFANQFFLKKVTSIRVVMKRLEDFLTISRWNDSLSLACHCRLARGQVLHSVQRGFQCSLPSHPVRATNAGSHPHFLPSTARRI